MDVPKLHVRACIWFQLNLSRGTPLGNQQFIKISSCPLWTLTYTLIPIQRWIPVLPKWTFLDTMAWRHNKHTTPSRIDSHTHTHISALRHARTLSAAGKCPAVGSLQIASDYSGFAKIQWREKRERREKKRGRRVKKRKAINKFWAARQRLWLSNPFLFIRLWFVFWWGRALLCMGRIKGVCWWMKFLSCLFMSLGPVNILDGREYRRIRSIII